MSGPGPTRSVGASPHLRRVPGEGVSEQPESEDWGGFARRRPVVLGRVRTDSGHEKAAKENEQKGQCPAIGPVSLGLTGPSKVLLALWDPPRGRCPPFSRAVRTTRHEPRVPEPQYPSGGQSRYRAGEFCFFFNNFGGPWRNSSVHRPGEAGKREADGIEAHAPLPNHWHRARAARVGIPKIASPSRGAGSDVGNKKNKNLVKVGVCSRGTGFEGSI